MISTVWSLLQYIVLFNGARVKDLVFFLVRVKNVSNGIFSRKTLFQQYFSPVIYLVFSEIEKRKTKTYLSINFLFYCILHTVLFCFHIILFPLLKKKGFKLWLIPRFDMVLFSVPCFIVLEVWYRNKTTVLIIAVPVVL